MDSFDVCFVFLALYSLPRECSPDDEGELHIV
jgi:hypothetical protein